jgi:7-keto-8-aminopelargonate synthetase-like enzyme
MQTTQTANWTQDTFESLDALQASLNSLQAHHRLRQPASCPDDLINFATNDYLGLSQHPRLIEAAKLACSQGVGTGGSRLVTGTLDIHRILEAELAQWMGFPRALVFNSGYQANVGLLSAMVNRGDWVFMDKLNHASLIDGCMMAQGQLKRYPHGDFERLESMLKDSQPKDTQKASRHQRFIVSDTLFSMDGDIAPLYRLLDLAQQYGAWLILD